MKTEKPAGIAAENESQTGSKENEAPFWQPGLILFTKLSGWIAGPVIAGIFVGKWLDKKYGTEPWLFLVSVGTAFLLSMFGIVHDSLREMARIEKEEERKKKKIGAEEINNHGK